MGRRETNDKVQPKHKPKLEKKISLLAPEDMFRVSARVELESASLQKPHQTITFLQKLSYFTYQKIPSKHHIRNFHYAPCQTCEPHIKKIPNSDQTKIYDPYQVSKKDQTREFQNRQNSIPPLLVIWNNCVICLC